MIKCINYTMSSSYVDTTRRSSAFYRPSVITPDRTTVMTLFLFQKGTPKRFTNELCDSSPRVSGSGFFASGLALGVTALGLGVTALGREPWRSASWRFLASSACFCAWRRVRHAKQREATRGNARQREAETVQQFRHEMRWL